MGRMVRRWGPVNVRHLQQCVMDEWNGMAQSMSEVRGDDAAAIVARSSSKRMTVILGIMSNDFFVVTSVLRTDVIKRNAGYQIATLPKQRCPSICHFCDF